MKSPSTVYKWRFYKKKSVSHYCVYKTSSCTCPSDPYKSNHILEKIPRISFTQMNDFPKVEKIHMKVIIQNVRCVISKRVRIYKIRWLASICCVINLRKITSDFIHADGWFSQGQKNNNNNANAVGIASWKLNVKCYEVTVRYSSRLPYIQAHIWARWGLNLYRVRQTSLRWPDSP